MEIQIIFRQKIQTSNPCCPIDAMQCQADPNELSYSEFQFPYHVRIISVYLLHLRSKILTCQILLRSSYGMRFSDTNSLILWTSALQTPVIIVFNNMGTAVTQAYCE